MNEAKKKALAKDLQEMTEKDLFFLAKLSLKYDMSIAELLSLVAEGYKIMAGFADTLDTSKFEIEEDQ